MLHQFHKFEDEKNYHNIILSWHSHSKLCDDCIYMFNWHSL